MGLLEKAADLRNKKKNDGLIKKAEEFSGPAEKQIKKKRLKRRNTIGTK